MATPKVLIIDDEPILRTTLQKSLKNLGYNLFFAENGQEGLELFQQESPELVFLDLRMPVMDGFGFLESVGIQPSAPYTIVVITGHGGDLDIKRSYELGVHCFLKKPLNMIEINSLADRCIKFKKMEQERESLIKELEEALAAVSTLEGLLPICASCKRVRNHKDEWMPLEKYIATHTSSKITHSVCPSCVKKLYPDLADAILSSVKKSGENPI